jgi:conjugal transfer pilus assembly protein TraV
MNKPQIISVMLFLVFLSGCTVKGEYACGVPQNGVRCQPMNETHAQLYDGSLSSLQTDPFPEESTIDKSSEYADDFNATGDNEYPVIASQTPDSTPVSKAPVMLPSITTVSGIQAILSPPREMRIWFDRFTDPEGDLHDESFVFIRLDNGHWLIDDKPVLY